MSSTVEELIEKANPAEQRVEDYGSHQLAKFSNISLQNPCRLGNLLPGDLTLLLSYPPPLFRSSRPLVGPSPPLPPVYDTLERKKVTKESHMSASPERPNSQKTLRSVPECSTTKQVKQARVENWACINFSCVKNEETSKFVSELRDICVTIGMEFAILEPSIMFHLDNPDSVAVHRTFSTLHGLVESEAMKMRTGLLIVILPDSRCYDAEVERRCKKLGVTYQNVLPQNVRTSTNKYLNSVACEINTKVLFRNVFCNALLNKQQCFQSTEQMGDDCVSENFSDKMGKDHGSTELCSQHLELKDGDTSEHCDEDMGEYDESCGVLDEEMWDSGNYNEDGNYDDSEDGDSDSEESDSDEDMRDSEESDSDVDMREDMVDKNSNTAAGHIVNDNFIGRTGMSTPIERRLSEKQPWLMGVKSTKRDYSSYGNLKIHRGVVVDWACVNLSHLGQRQLRWFYSKLSSVCDSIHMCFNSSPLETYHEKSADPDNIANTFSNVLEDLSQQFAALDMEGETIGLVLVILPEARDIDAKIEDVCKEYGVLYHCLLPSVISMGEDESLKKLAYEIKSKVVKRDTFIPFVSEGPTLIFGAAASCNAASVVAPLKWQKFRNYKAVFGPNNGAIIEDLFSNEEDGGTISNLLCPFRKKIERGCRIIFFRHCDTEDHISNIWQHEVHAIKLGCSQLEIGCKPSVTFVVVGGNQDESSNIGKADFVCHHGFVKGTTPNRYRVVHDDNNLTVEQLESIIIKLCLLRDHRAFPSISMVPPAYAAWYVTLEN